eukprot:scaffold13490_cov69-Attheya_sp.AAC.5
MLCGYWGLCGAVISLKSIRKGIWDQRFKLSRWQIVHQFATREAQAAPIIPRPRQIIHARNLQYQKQAEKDIQYPLDTTTTMITASPTRYDDFQDHLAKMEDRLNMQMEQIRDNFNETYAMLQEFTYHKTTVHQLPGRPVSKTRRGE